MASEVKRTKAPARPQQVQRTVGGDEGIGTSGTLLALLAMTATIAVVGALAGSRLPEGAAPREP